MVSNTRFLNAVAYFCIMDGNICAAAIGSVHGSGRIWHWHAYS